MNGIYWRPRRVPRQVLVAIAAAAVLAAAAVEWLPWKQTQPDVGEKLAAATLAQRGMDRLREERLSRGHTIDLHFDPADTGLIGESMSLVTSVPGNLRAKQTSINPNFAAAIVQMLREAGVKQGDRVAVGCSGSFPVLNLCVYSALETLEAKPVVVASACASQFGANLPDLMWVDMEHLLHEEGLFSFRSLAASPGGYEDCARGMSSDTRRLVLEAIERNGLTLLDAEELSESIDQRMDVYQEEAGGERFAAYINVGGGAASVGRTEGKKRYQPGLNLTPPATATEIDSVMTRFAKRGVPVIHLVESNELAAKFGLPEAPQERPAVGTGGVFEQRRYNRLLAAVLLVGLVVALRSVVWTGLIARVKGWWEIARGRATAASVYCLYEAEGEPMV
ncbi:MAG: poly-gamma-glutamate system protein [Pirellulaceae bacterium]